MVVWVLATELSYRPERGLQGISAVGTSYSAAGFGACDTAKEVQIAGLFVPVLSREQKCEKRTFMISFFTCVCT